MIEQVCGDCRGLDCVCPVTAEPKCERCGLTVTDDFIHNPSELGDCKLDRPPTTEPAESEGKACEHDLYLPVCSKCGEYVSPTVPPAAEDAKAFVESQYDVQDGDRILMTKTSLANKLNEYAAKQTVQALRDARAVIEKYGDEGMWEYTYSKRRGGSCGDIQCPNHVCTKSEFMSKYDGWKYARKWLDDNPEEK